MTLKEIREHWHQGPFRPLIIRLSSGRTHRVDHPDYLFVPPVGDSFMVVSKKGEFHHISAGLVEEIEVGRASRKVKADA